MEKTHAQAGKELQGHFRRKINKNSLLAKGIMWAYMYVSNPRVYIFFWEEKRKWEEIGGFYLLLYFFFTC